jgi:hypothetical protein
MTLFHKKIIVMKSREVKTGCNPAESSEEGYASKRAVLPMMSQDSSVGLLAERPGFDSQWGQGTFFYSITGVDKYRVPGHHGA